MQFSSTTISSSIQKLMLFLNISINSAEPYAKLLAQVIVEEIDKNHIPNKFTYIYLTTNSDRDSSLA
jgi:hypothetical protein